VTTASTEIRDDGSQERPVVVVDASNVCLAKRDELGRPKLSNLLAIQRLLLDLGFELVLFCDANLKYVIDDADGLQRLLGRGDVLQVPAGTDADVWILDAAARLGARVVSNDTYREYHRRFPWIRERRVPFMFVNGQLLVPDLVNGFAEPLRGAEQKAVDADREPAAPTSAADSLHALVRDLLGENDALRTQRDRLLSDCDELGTQISEAAARAADAEARCDGVRSTAAALDQQRAQLDAHLAETRSLLEIERERNQTAHHQLQVLESEGVDLRQRCDALTTRVSTLERALAAARPDAQLEEKVERLLRETLKVVKSQSEPIKRALHEAVETRKAVVAVQADQRSLAQHADAISKSLERRPDGDPQPCEPGPITDTTWSTRFPRVEQAWLAGHSAGDRSEEDAFLRVAGLLRSVDHSLDAERLLVEVDAFAARVGDGFSYAALLDAARRTHKPSLRGDVLVIRTRESIRRARGAIPGHPCAPVARRHSPVLPLRANVDIEAAADCSVGAPLASAPSAANTLPNREAVA
jgi:Zc3h12a-like Ribonuclease NYN domain